jgi:hypothetical protein
MSDAQRFPLLSSSATTSVAVKSSILCIAIGQRECCFALVVVMKIVQHLFCGDSSEVVEFFSDCGLLCGVEVYRELEVLWCMCCTDVTNHVRRRLILRTLHMCSVMGLYTFGRAPLTASYADLAPPSFCST